MEYHFDKKKINCHYRRVQIPSGRNQHEFTHDECIF